MNGGCSATGIPGLDEGMTGPGSMEVAREGSKTTRAAPFTGPPFFIQCNISLVVAELRHRNRQRASRIFGLGNGVRFMETSHPAPRGLDAAAAGPLKKQPKTIRRLSITSINFR